MLPTKFRFIWQSGFRGEDFKKSANQKQELPVVAMFFNGSGRNEQLYREPAINASYHVSAHLAKRFQRRRFFLLDQSETKLSMAAMFVNGSGQNEQSLERIFHRCFLPSFSSVQRRR